MKRECVHVSAERGKGRQIEILIVPSFLQARNVIKGIIDLVLILPSGCYLFLQHDEKSPLWWWNAKLFLEILVPKQHVLLYGNVPPQWQQNPNTFGSNSYHPTVSKMSWYVAVTRKTFLIRSAMCKNFSWKTLKRGLKWGRKDLFDMMTYMFRMSRRYWQKLACWQARGVSTNTSPVHLIARTANSTS